MKNILHESKIIELGVKKRNEDIKVRRKQINIMKLEERKEIVNIMVDHRIVSLTPQVNIFY
ncbi:MAG: hypothetical protein DRI86_14860 [Bacteroidetes bacterium]|nr:MAG: hypothetical protein DRI86_14860 [Bacteroidota bacterium]